jgi:hypothetical protein
MDSQISEKEGPLKVVERIEAPSPFLFSGSEAPGLDLGGP